ncbi:LysR family transcriptional regulator [Ectobacillus panaciterrae]|uniref:LysR family transcriptional regulator n=1 Tax=Ectobacillus panaciterrae TaxID=363872 RepID=UPI0003F7C8CF|nr:LysR family transcriptional regulator [Ectobacillus panaciterrae]
MIVDTLKIFVTVVEQKHFSRAAEILNLSQPGVSLHIRNLENELGVKLITRSPKHVQVTEAGEILYIRSKQILSHYEEAKKEINELFHVVTGNLRIGASFTIGEYILPKVLAEYTNQHPRVDIQVMISNTEEVIQALRFNTIDIGLIEGKVIHADIEADPFMEDEMIVIVPPQHPLSQRRVIEKERLQNQVWILREQGSGTRTYSDQFIRDLHLKMQRHFIFSSIQGVKEAVAAGLGIAVLSSWTVRKELEAREVHTFRIKNVTLKRQFSIVRQKQSDASSKAVEVFLRKIEEFAAEHKL